MLLARRLAGIIAPPAIGCAATWYVLVVRPFHGVADADNVQIAQTEFASNKHVAMLVERSDKAALSGNDFFVFITDHLYSVPELRKNLYALDPVFHVGRNGLALQWIDPENLKILCEDCGITKNQITTQKFSDSGVTIHYVGFP
jgi:hypothetical protein